jgi:hypothetical protein
MCRDGEDKGTLGDCKTHQRVRDGHRRQRAPRSVPVDQPGASQHHRWVDPADLAGTDLTDETARTIRAWVAAR